MARGPHNTFSFKTFFLLIKSKGKVFNALFWFFFSMCVLPLLLFLVVALIRGNIGFIGLLIVLIGMIVLEIREQDVFRLSLLLVILNIFLWFMLGLLPFVQNFFSWLPGITVYLLLAPYALVSGGWTYQLLIRAAQNNKRSVFKAFILISTMIAVVTATTHFIQEFALRLQGGVDKYGAYAPYVGAVVEAIVLESLYNPVIGFFLVLCLFNAGMLFRYLYKTKNYKNLVWYCAPISIFFLLSYVLRAF